MLHAKIPPDLILCWEELLRAWREALDVWWMPNGMAEPIHTIAERTVSRLTLFELEALIRHLSEKIADPLYIAIVGPGYANFWEVWVMAAILEQGRRLTALSKNEST